MNSTESGTINCYNEPDISYPTPSIDLFTLPEEVQEEILDYLEVKDLTSCCQVCRLWRAGINSSRIWKKWCQIEWYKPEIMEKFGPTDDDSSCMGYWRKVYCWHARLKMNWRTRTCRKFKLIDSDSSVYCFDTDGELVATGHEDSTVIVWSMKIPPRVIDRLKGVLNSNPICSICIDGRILVVLQRGLIQVYYRADDKYEMTDLKCFETGDANIDQMENYLKQKNDYSSWYLECLRASDRGTAGSGAKPRLTFCVFKGLLYASRHHSRTVRVWTVPNSEVQFMVEGPGEICQIIKTHDDGVYFVTRDQITHLMKYEVGSETPKILLSVPGLKHISVDEELVLAFPARGDVTLERVWVYKRGDYSQPIGTRSSYGLTAVAILPPKLVVYSKGTDITVWDPVRNESLAIMTLNDSVSYLIPAYASFLLVLKSRSLYLLDWKGNQMYRIFDGLERTGHFGYLLWSNATTLLARGVANQLEMISFHQNVPQPASEEETYEIPVKHIGSSSSVDRMYFSVPAIYSEDEYLPT